MRLAEEFDFELVLQHATEGYRIADELVKRKIPVSLTLVDSPGGKLEAAGLLEENAAILDKAGVKVAINTDDSITESRFFLRTGAIAVRGGMSEDAALQALTINGAEMLHLDDRLGSLEKGKDADFVVLSGPPFSVYTQVLQTYIDGTMRLRPLAAQATGPTRPAASPWPTATACRRRRRRSSRRPPSRRPPSRGKRPPFAGTPARFAVLRRPHPHRQPGRRSSTASSWSRTARSRRSAPRDEVDAARRTCRC